MKKVRLAQPQFADADLDEIGADVRSILQSGWLTTGRFASKLETSFKERVGTRYAVTVNSGTAALHIMTAWLRLGREDEVIVPANTFASTANAVLYEHARPVLADCDLSSFNVARSTIEPKISSKTRAVIVTHVGGNPCEMKEIQDLCRDKGLVLFEDAAHAIGASYHGRPCGSLSAGAAFSLYPTKVVTSAEGGVLTTDSEEFADFAKLYRNVGRRELGAGPIEILGHNYRLSDIHAAIGLNQMKHLSDFVEKRNALAGVYSKELRDLPWVKPQTVGAGSKSSYYCYIIRLLPKASPISRDDLMARLANRGIETTIMFRPVDSQPYFREFRRGNCPNAQSVGNETLVLPLHTMMKTADIKYVVSAIREVAAG